MTDFIESSALVPLVDDETVSSVYLDYLERRKENSPFLLSEKINTITDTEQRAIAIGGFVLDCYDRDIFDRDLIKATRRTGLFNRVHNEDHAAAASFASDMTTIIAVLRGSEWFEDVRREIIGATHTPKSQFLQAEGTAGRILGIPTRRRLIMGAKASMARDRIESAVLEKSPEVRERVEAGEPTDKVLSGIKGFVALGAIEYTMLSLWGATLFTKKEQRPALLKHFDNLIESRALKNGASQDFAFLEFAPSDITQAVDFARDMVNQEGLSIKGLSDAEVAKIQEAVAFFRTQISYLLGNITILSIADPHPEQFEPFDPDAQKRQELEDLKSAAEQARQEKQQTARQRAEQEVTLLERFKQELSALIRENDDLASGWNVSSTEIKKRGLGDLIGSLIRGLKDSNEEIVFDGISKNDARTLVCTIETLYKICAGSENKVKATEQLEQGYEDQGVLRAKFDDFKDRAGVLKKAHLDMLMNASPKLFSSRELVDHLSEVYPTIRDAIRHLHPKGKQVVEQLDALFATESTKENLDELTLPEAVDPERQLVGIAEQLDQIILPAESTIGDLIIEIGKLDLPEDEVSEIDWNRLYDLVRLRNSYDGKLYRSKKGSLGGAPPYFVVEIVYNGCTFAVAESPVEGNATYIIDEKEIGGTWLEALTLSKADARVMGAHRIVHRNGSHRDKIENCIIDLMTKY